MRLHRRKIRATHARETNNAAAKAARTITTMLYFCGSSASDVTPTSSARAVDEVETIPSEADDVVTASVGVFRWTDEFETRVLFIDGFNVGSVAVTMGNKENTILNSDAP